MNYQGVGTLDISNCLILRNRQVTAGDLDVNGLLTLDLDSGTTLAPILVLDDGLTINGLKITDGGQDVMPTWLADGMTLSFRNFGAGSTINHESASVAAAYRFATGDGQPLTVGGQLQPTDYVASASRWSVVPNHSTGDYTSTQIANISQVAGGDVSAALEGGGVLTKMFTVTSVDAKGVLQLTWANIAGGAHIFCPLAWDLSGIHVSGAPTLDPAQELNLWISSSGVSQFLNEDTNATDDPTDRFRCASGLDTLFGLNRVRISWSTAGGSRRWEVPM